jgi:coenzyme PQQ precursor peptide PqqA
MSANSPPQQRPRLEVTRMTWEAPDFVEVKMDAEINSYQDDFGPEPDDRF